MKVIGIIPVRMAATRFPNKPLAKICGLPMVEHVRRRVLLCPELDDVWVATCDQDIRKVVEQFGGKVVMTAETHERCTDRIAEAASGLKADVIVNIQGDEPLIMPEMIAKIIRPFKEDPALTCVNMVSPIVSEDEFLNPNAPKVVTDLKNQILYISREPIPSARKAASPHYRKLKQLGLIAFRYDFLQVFSRLSPTPAEIVESVDMMRAIEHGYTVLALEDARRMIGVDVPSDVPLVEKLLEMDTLFNQYKDTNDF